MSHESNISFIGEKIYARRSKTGLVLIIVGFILQFIGNIIS